MHAYLEKLWLRIQEPRALSVIYFFGYMLLLGMGAAVAIDPPRTLQGTLGHTMVIYWGWMLVIGGAIGTATVLQGAWLFERAGAWMCMFALAIYGIAMSNMPISQLSLRVATLCFVMFAILAFAARLVHTRRYAYDPER